jgi:cobalt/nickel transport system permease protein
MSKLACNLFDIGYLDTFSGGTSAVHRLDPRAKLITTLGFIVAVVSFDKYALSALIPFCVFPVALAAESGLPARYLLKKVLILLPVATVIALGNPLFDRQIAAYIGPWGISGGWISFFSVIVRFAFTVSAVLVLIATTGLNAVCMGLSKLGVPRPFVVQLLLLYRYIFVLMEEAGKMVRACALRSFDRRAMSLRTFNSLIGCLLVRAIDRSERVYLAMRSRGFDGRVRILRTMKAGPRETAFTAGWLFVFVILRCYNIPVLLGKMIAGAG